ncbi:MAG: flavodoxin [Clostridia bacterium]|nr:flavodoxin [Clostridia bacterium]
MTKRIIAALLALALLLAGSALSEGALVVYFSRAGENYSVGEIEEGNTARLAKLIAARTGAEIFEIAPAVDYPASYDECLAIATEERNSDARPAYIGDVEGWEDYDTVFIGHPIWWGTVPRIVYTFIENHDFTGKTVAPFNTHEGSGRGDSQQVMEGLLTDAAAVLQGLAVRGATAQNDAEAAGRAVADWLNELDIDQ